MNNVEVWNTKEKGVFKFVIYPEGRRFIGVCLTLNIIEESKNPHQLLENLKEAAFGHLEVVRKENLDDALLNRHAPKEYWEKYYSVSKNRTDKLLKEVGKILKKRKEPFLTKEEAVYTR